MSGRLSRCLCVVTLLQLLGAVAFGATAAPSEYVGETKEQRNSRMAWFRDAKFGMFVHWGVYSVPAGEWNGRTDCHEWFVQQTGMPLSQYVKFRDQLNPVKFDAKQWVAMAKDAGVKYIVITSKHHDGFCMFDTKLTDWCITSTPYKRDPMKDLAAACGDAGIRLCFYYSLLNWHNSDFVPHLPNNDLAAGKPDFDRYVQFMKGQLTELLTNYGPIGVLWFDGFGDDPWTIQHGKDLYAHVRSLQPQIIVNNRVGKPEIVPGAGYLHAGAVGDYGTPEQLIPGAALGPDDYWESCMTMNDNWGYNKHDQNWKSPKDLIRHLIDIVGKGGNFLLNVGPTSEGLIPAPGIERFREMGKWLKLNGEAIYGATAGPFANTPSWGRATQKPGKIFLHVFDWPSGGKLVVPQVDAKKITNVYLLADASRTPLGVTAQQDGVEIAVPAQAPDPIASAVVIEVAP